MAVELDVSHLRAVQYRYCKCLLLIKVVERLALLQKPTFDLRALHFHCMLGGGSGQ